MGIEIQKIIDYIDDTDGRWFFTTDVNKAFHLVEVSDTTHVRVMLKRLVEKGLLEKHKYTDGRWRRIDSTAPPLMDFAKATKSHPVECYLPFHLEDFVNIYPSNVFVFSGVSNYGKTEMLMMTAYLNQHTEGVYLNTDADEEEMLVRVQNYQPYDCWRTKFPRKVVSAEIPNLIAKHYKDKFIYLDYLKVMKDYFEISSLIEDCAQAVGKGLLFVGLQKNKGVEWARGGQQTLDLSRFYVNLDPGPADIDRVNGFTYSTTELKVIKSKMPKNPNYSMNGWKFIYRMEYHDGNIPTYKMLYEPPEYIKFNNARKLEQFRALKPPEQEVVEEELDFELETTNNMFDPKEF